MTDAEFDFDSRPEAIRRAIEARIVDGKMRPGDRLGLKSDLQKEFDVAGPTIAQALTLLTNDGLIAMRQRPRRRHLRRAVAARDPRRDEASGHRVGAVARREHRDAGVADTAAGGLGSEGDRPGHRGGGQAPRGRPPPRRRPTVVRHPAADLVRPSRLVDLADNELVGHFYLDLLDTAEALIVDVAFPTEGIEGDQERQRIATHASMFLAVADGSVEAARHHAELVRLVSRPLREPRAD